MSTNIKPIKINTSTNAASTFLDRAYKISAQQRIGLELFGVMNDVATIACQFVQDDPNTDETVVLVLSGASALRCTLYKELVTGTEVYVQQVLFNEGVFPENEDLATGKVTWRLPIVSATLEAFLGTDSFVDIFIEFTWVDECGANQTLGQMPFRVKVEGDTGAIGSPPPSLPTYMDSVTALATFVLLSSYLNPVTIAVDTVLTDVPGLQVYFIDTDGGPVLITLPPSASSDARYSPLIMNIGSNTLSIAPDGGAPDSINGSFGTQTIIGQYGAYSMKNDPANNNFFVPNFLIP